MPRQPHLAVRASLRLGLWIAVLCVAIALLTAMGRGELGIPSILDPSAWGPWAAQRDAATIVFAALRAATLVVAWYLLGATLVGTFSRMVRSARLVAVADLLTVPAVRRLLQSALGVGLATAALAAGSGGGGAPQAPAVAAASIDQESVEMTPLEADSAVLVPVPPVPREVRSEPAAQQRDEWTVRPGEHFWSIAEAVLTQRKDARPGDDEVSEYWERLIDANRSRLADRGNPDLLYPGQTLRLPSIEGDDAR